MNSLYQARLSTKDKLRLRQTIVDKEVILNWLFGFGVASAVMTMSLLFLWLIGDVTVRGIGSLSWELLSEQVMDSGRAGGIAPVLVSTSIIVLLALLVAFPIALLVAILISEYLLEKSTSTRSIIAVLDVLAGIPSVVFGLFGNALFNQYLGFGYSLLSGGLTLAFMVLPFVTKAIVESLRLVPNSFREAGSSLALSRTTMLVHVLLPAALPGILAGLLLGFGRALAETAALLFTSGYVSRMPESLMDSGRTVSIHVYDLAMNVAGGDSMAYASALVLVILLIIINSTIVFLGNKLQLLTLHNK